MWITAHRADGPVTTVWTGENSLGLSTVSVVQPRDATNSKSHRVRVEGNRAVTRARHPKPLLPVLRDTVRSTTTLLDATFSERPLPATSYGTSYWSSQLTCAKPPLTGGWVGCRLVLDVGLEAGTVRADEDPEHPQRQVVRGRLRRVPEAAGGVRRRRVLGVRNQFVAAPVVAVDHPGGAPVMISSLRCWCIRTGRDR